MDGMRSRWPSPGVKGWPGGHRMGDGSSACGSRARFVIYTPGSDAGYPLSIVQSLQKPDLSWSARQSSCATDLGHRVGHPWPCVNVASDPITGREHALLATLIERAWQDGRDMDLAQLIAQVRTGLPLTARGPAPGSVLPGKGPAVAHAGPERPAGIATALRSGWRRPLQVDTLLRSPDGRPFRCPFCTNGRHLSDGERAFFYDSTAGAGAVWLRRQERNAGPAGDPVHRRVVRLDAAAPANPPTKAALLTLLKQAVRRPGVSTLCTQNPVDLDYKGLSKRRYVVCGKAADGQRLGSGAGGTGGPPWRRVCPSIEATFPRSLAASRRVPSW